MTGEHESQGIVPVGHIVDQVLGAEYVAEVTAERGAARSQRQAEQGTSALSHGQRLADLPGADEVRQYASEWQASFERSRADVQRRRRAGRRPASQRPTQRLSDALGFDATYTHDIGMSATERGLGREMLRGLLNGGLDLTDLDIAQDEEGNWQVEFVGGDEEL